MKEKKKIEREGGREEKEDGEGRAVERDGTGNQDQEEVKTLKN